MFRTTILSSALRFPKYSSTSKAVVFNRSMQSHFRAPICASCCDQSSLWVKRKYPHRPVLSAPLSSGTGSEKDGHKEKDANPSLKAMAVVTLAACGIGAYLNIRNFRASEKAGVVVGASIGRPTLGGSFELVDHNKKRVSEADFKGKWMFIYFGFTYCPDICPNELVRMREVIELLDKSPATSNKVTPIFITIDPARDGPDQLKSYLSDWHPKLVGLTGSQEQINDVCKKYRVYFNKAQLGPDPSDYLIDHSVMFYLVDADSRFMDYFAKNLSPQDMAARITAYMRQPQ